jgi:hypothetical protein
MERTEARKGGLRLVECDGQVERVERIGHDDLAGRVRRASSNEGVARNRRRSS